MKRYTLLYYIALSLLVTACAEKETVLSVGQDAVLPI